MEINEENNQTGALAADDEKPVNRSYDLINFENMETTEEKPEENSEDKIEKNIEDRTEEETDKNIEENVEQAAEKEKENKVPEENVEQAAEREEENKVAEENPSEIPVLTVDESNKTSDGLQETNGIVEIHLTDDVEIPSGAAVVAAADDIDSTKQLEKNPSVTVDSFTKVPSISSKKSSKIIHPKAVNEDYLKALDEVEKQNTIVNGIKEQLQEAISKGEKFEESVLRDTFNKEMKLLEMILKKVILLQKKDPAINEPITLPTTLEEDNIPQLVMYAPDMVVKKNVKGISNTLKIRTASGSLSGLGESEMVEKLAKRDKIIDSLQEKMQTMETDMYRICEDNNKMAKKISCLQKNQIENRPTNEERETCVEKRLELYKKNICLLEQNIDQMAKELKRLQCELHTAKQSNPCEASEPEPLAHQSARYYNERKPAGKSFEVEHLRQQYTTLLTEYGKKMGKIKELNEKLKIAGSTEDDFLNDPEVSLQKQIKEFEDEREDLKSLLREQSSQLHDYRDKYLKAQQTAEEQRVKIETIQMNNQRIEEQINLEIHRIKCKFQEKLCELAHLPRLLENEQLKVATATKKNRELEIYLRATCEELQSLRNKCGPSEKTGKINYEENYKMAMEEMENLKLKLEQILNEKNAINLKLNQTKEELNILRSESTKIIARTKERSEQTKEAMQQVIDKLELNLAQCRAAATLTVTDKEALIQQMQNQLNIVSESFNNSQMQIYALKQRLEGQNMQTRNCPVCKQK